MTRPERRRLAEDDDTPPLLGSWRALYALVLAELAALIGLFYALTRWAS